MRALCYALVLFLSCSWALAQDDTTVTDAQRIQDAYARLQATQQATPATRPSDQQLEIQKLRQEVYQLQDQVEQLRAENTQLRQQLGLGPVPVAGKPRTDFEQRVKDVFAGEQNTSTEAGHLAEAASIDKALNAWCAANSPDDDTAEALWAGKVEIGLPWSAIALTGYSQIKSEAADVQVYKFVPIFTDHVDLITVEDGKIAEIDHE